MNRFLGIDVGSSSVKLAVTDVDGNVLAFDQEPHSSVSPHPGWVEFDPREIWSSIVAQARRMNAVQPGMLSAVRGIGLSVFCPGLIAMGEGGSPLSGAITFADSRSAPEARELATVLQPAELFALSANRLMPGACSVTSILWIQRHLPQVDRQTRWFGHLNSYLGARMTGRIGIDPSNASYTGLYDTGGATGWSVDLAQKLGIEASKLPQIVPSFAAVGELCSRELVEAGLPAGIPVAMGGGDTACSALAVGAVQHHDLFESAGTTNVISLCSNLPMFDERFMNRCHVVPDRWLYHGAMSSTGAALLWLRDHVFELSSSELFAELLQRAATLDPSDSVPLFLPYMAGERTPVWDPYAAGVLFGLGLHARREHLLRAVMEGCGFGSRQILRIVEELADRPFDRVVSIGGGAKIPEWTQIKADITGCRHTVLDMNNAAVIGASLLATTASGARSLPDLMQQATVRFRKLDERLVWRTFVPNPELRETYQRKFDIYLELYPTLKHLFERFGNPQ